MLMCQMLFQPVFVRDDEGNGIGTLVVIQDQLVDAGRMFDERLLDPFRTVFLPVTTDQQAFEICFASTVVPPYTFPLIITK